MKKKKDLEEKLIDFKTAILARECGFEEACKYYYFNNGLHKEVQILQKPSGYDVNWNDNEYYGVSKDGWKHYSAPNQALLQMWLRENHKLYVLVDYNFKGFFIKTKSYHKSLGEVIEIGICLNQEYFKSYEKAVEKGLYAALKTIKKDIKKPKAKPVK